MGNIEERELTFGEKAVGITFNPSGSQEVQDMKEDYAFIIDILNDLRTRNNETGRIESSEKNRLLSVAITEAQGAQMWAVKALTWKD